MTKTQVGILAVLILALTVPYAMQRRAGADNNDEARRLRAELAALQPLVEENRKLSNKLAAVTRSAELQKEQLNELMRLRGEVGGLRKAVSENPPPSPASRESMLSGITANPEMQKMIRDQQKMALGMIYQGLAKQAGLSEEQSKALTDVLADNVMTNIAHITEALKAGKTPEEMEAVFAAQEAILKERVKETLGLEAYSAYESYTQNIASYLTAQQFKGMLPGEQEAKEAKSKQLFELMQRETQQVLASHGLPQDYQTVPTLNFRNIAFEEIGERNIILLDSIYERVAAGATDFLTPDELAKFAEFRKMAVDNNRLALTVNRKMMAPPPK